MIQICDRNFIKIEYLAMASKCFDPDGVSTNFLKKTQIIQ